MVSGSRLATSEKIFRFHPEREGVLLTNILRIIGGSLIAFLMEVSEYLLLSYTSSLTLSIAGILKVINHSTLAFGASERQQLDQRCAVPEASKE